MCVCVFAIGKLGSLTVYYDITVLHVSAYTVVREMCQVNGEGHFSATWGSETPEPIHLKSGTFDYIHSPTPHTKYGGRRKWRVGWAYG